MSSMIKSHNKKVTNKDVKESKSCNCRVNSECPLNGQYQVTDIIYTCTVLSPDKPNKVYLGTAEGVFKKGFFNLRKSFNNEASTNDTTLSKYILELKETSNLSLYYVPFSKRYHFIVIYSRKVFCLFTENSK